MKRSVLKGILLVAVAAAVTAEPQIISSMFAASGLSAPISIMKAAIMNLLLPLMIAAAEGAFLERVGRYVIGKAIAASGFAAPIGVIRLAGDTKTMREGLDFAGNFTRFATSFVANSSDHISHLAKTGLNSTAVLGKEAIEGSAKLTKQGLGLVKKFAKYVPGYDIMLTMGANAGLSGLPIVESVAKTGLNLVTKGSNKVVTLGDQIVKGGAGAVDTIAQTGIGIGKSAVNQVDKVKNSLGRFTGGIIASRAKARSLVSKKTNNHY